MSARQHRDVSSAPPLTFIHNRMSFATLRALYAIIGDALADLERIYQAQPSSTDGIPLDFPSLDEPCYPGVPQSADAAAAEKLALAPDAVVAARQIVAACAQLSASVHLPFYSLVEGVKGVRACCPVPLRADVIGLTEAVGLYRDISRRASGSLRPRTPSRFSARPGLGAYMPRILRVASLRVALGLKASIPLR